MSNNTVIKNVKTDNIYETRQLTTSLSIPPKMFNYSDVNNIILTKLKKKVEGKCISDGYIKEESVKIISRSLGMLLNHDFDSNVNYEILYSAEVCNPREGQLIEAIVNTVDETNTVCYYMNEDMSPIEIYLFKQHYLENQEYAVLKSGDRIIVKILETQIEFGSTKILAIAEFIKKV